MELQHASEYMDELVQLRRRAQDMEIVPGLVHTVELVNIPGLSSVLYAYYRKTQSRHLTRAHKKLLRLERCYCDLTVSRCWCLENQALLHWCWLKFASLAELQTVAQLLAAYAENNFCSSQYTCFD